MVKQVVITTVITAVIIMDFLRFFCGVVNSMVKSVVITTVITVSKKPVSPLETAKNLW